MPYLKELSLSSSSIVLGSLLQDILHTARDSLEMEVAFISQFADGRRIFRVVDSGPETASILTVGNSDPLEDSYCQRVVDGRLPKLIQDASQLEEALKLAATLAIPVGAHLSVPIKFADGSIYGTFCCFSRKPNYALQEADLKILQAFSNLAGKLIEISTAAERQLKHHHDAINACIHNAEFTNVYQPIFHIADNTIVGYESLTRFQMEGDYSTEEWFDIAAQVELTYPLECCVANAAMKAQSQLQAGQYFTINVSAETILSCPNIEAMIGDTPETLVLEVTEHEKINDYARVTKKLAPFRKRGLRIAVDDAGAGYASFRHILELKPDIIKIDRSLISGIDQSNDQIALAAALVTFADKIKARIVAEGVETVSELHALQALGVEYAQGYLLGRPAPQFVH